MREFREDERNVITTLGYVLGVSLILLNFFSIKSFFNSLKPEDNFWFYLQIFFNILYYVIPVFLLFLCTYFYSLEKRFQKIILYLFGFCFIFLHFINSFGLFIVIFLKPYYFLETFSIILYTLATIIILSIIKDMLAYLLKKEN